MADFLFQYKQSQQYPHESSSYYLRAMMPPVDVPVIKSKYSDKGAPTLVIESKKDIVERGLARIIAEAIRRHALQASVFLGRLLFVSFFGPGGRWCFNDDRHNHRGRTRISAMRVALISTYDANLYLHTLSCRLRVSG